MSETVVTRRLTIHGRVQGVYFRDSMRQQARQLSVTGWVRNRSDGTVEAMVHGKPDAIEKMIEWSREGPEMARVTDIYIEEAQGQFDSFKLLSTA